MTQTIHSPSKFLVWVKKRYHVWLDQNFDPFLLTNLTCCHGKKHFFFQKKKLQNDRLKKTTFFKIANSQNFFIKISWIDVAQPIWP